MRRVSSSSSSSTGSRSSSSSSSGCSSSQKCSSVSSSASSSYNSVSKGAPQVELHASAKRKYHEKSESPEIGQQVESSSKKHKSHSSSSQKKSENNNNDNNKSLSSLSGSKDKHKGSSKEERHTSSSSSSKKERKRKHQHHSSATATEQQYENVTGGTFCQESSVSSFEFSDADPSSSINQQMGGVQQTKIINNNNHHHVVNGPSSGVSSSMDENKHHHQSKQSTQMSIPKVVSPSSTTLPSTPSSDPTSLSSPMEACITPSSCPPLAELFCNFLAEMSQLCDSTLDKLRQYGVCPNAGSWSPSSGKKEKRKAPIDPNRPKRPGNAFTVFISDMRAKLAKSGDPFNMKEAGAMWKELSDEGKRPYELIAQERKENFAHQMNELKSSKPV